MPSLQFSMPDLSKYLGKSCGFDLDQILVPPGKTVSLKKRFDPAYAGHFKSKEAAQKELLNNVEELARQQDLLYASDTYALLLVFQALDAAGKDGTIKHVMSGVNPQGCQVFSFKSPSVEELDHDYLRRSAIRLPERGRIGIFNRSHYEEVLITRVHPDILTRQRLPAVPKGQTIWKQRFKQINHFEKYLSQNGIPILKFFLNVSKNEQKKRFLKRIEEKEKNWKFSANDIRERQFWDQYQDAYQEVFNHTSTAWAPWFIIPADNKSFAHLAVSAIVAAFLKSLRLKYPTISQADAEALETARQELLAEE
jgi:PPK2 family polyphosphate:nucleotide phosphotransferase